MDHRQLAVRSRRSDGHRRCAGFADRRSGSPGRRCGGRPQDIDWAITADGLRLLQARPITTAVNMAPIPLDDEIPPGLWGLDSTHSRRPTRHFWRRTSRRPWNAVVDGLPRNSVCRSRTSPCGESTGTFTSRSFRRSASRTPSRPAVDDDRVALHGEGATADLENFAGDGDAADEAGRSLRWSRVASVDRSRRRQFSGGADRTSTVQTPAYREYCRGHGRC